MSLYSTKESKSRDRETEQPGRRSISVRSKMNHHQEIEWPLEESGQLGWVLPTHLGGSANNSPSSLPPVSDDSVDSFSVFLMPHFCLLKSPPLLDFVFFPCLLFAQDCVSYCFFSYVTFLFLLPCYFLVLVF